MHSQGLSDSFLNLMAEIPHHLVYLVGGFDRPHRVFFVSQGDAKHCHHLIPDEFFNVTSTFDDHFGNLADDMTYQVFDFFWVQAL